MENTKVIALMSSLDSKEMKQLSGFLQSAYYNKNKNIHTFFTILEKMYPNFGKIDEEKIFRKIFKNTPFQAATLHQFSWQLVKSIEDFLIQQELENDLHYRRTALLKQLLHRRLDKYFLQEVKQAEKEFEGDVIKDEACLICYSTVQWLKSSHFNRHKNPHFTCDAAQKSHNAYVRATLIHLLFEQGAMDNMKNIFSNSFEYHIPVSKLLLENIDFSEYADTPLIYLQVLMQKLSANLAEETHYLALKDYFKAHKKAVPREMQYDVYINLLNHCIYQEVIGNSQGKIKDKYWLFKEMIEDDAWRKQQSYMHFAFFINVVRTAIQNNDKEWTLSFIDKYKSELTPDKVEPTLNFCYAFIAFHEKNYQEVIHLLYSTGQFTSRAYFITKALLLMAYYELGWYEQTLGLIDTFRHTLKTDDDITEKERNSYRLFLRFSEKLTRQKLELNPTRIERLVTEISGEYAAFGKQWLLEKLAKF